MDEYCFFWSMLELLGMWWLLVWEFSNLEFCEWLCVIYYLVCVGNMGNCEL